MTLQSFLVLLPAMISGGLLVHLIWSDRAVKSVFFKIFLGIGLGLGLNSLLYFLYLLIFNHPSGFFGVQILVLLALVAVTIFRERQHHCGKLAFNLPNRMQMMILVPTGAMLILALATYVTVSLRKPQGAWDSWMIYNRAARFIFRGGTHWADAFSPEMAWYFHTDYPPLVALNVASGWDALGQETIRIPMVVGGAFLFGCAGLLFAVLYDQKTLGQASLALMALFATSTYIEMGSKQIADIPLSFFILAAQALLFLYSTRAKRELLILAGLAAGLAAWTKNEGFQFFFISLVVIVFVYRRSLKSIFPWYALGFAFPLVLVVYFKMIAPPSDLFLDIPTQINQIFNPSRHLEILQAFGYNLKTLSNWIFLAVYLLIFWVDLSKESVPPFLAGLLIVLLQLAGYYSIFLITPHQLDWHLSALYRLLLQISPLIIFLYFSVVRPPETIFQNR